MHKLIILLLFIFSCNDETGGGSSSPDLDASRGIVSEGQEIYNSNCVTCHGQEASGVQGLGPNITNVTINRIYDVLTFEDLVPDMRDFVGQFRDEDIEDIAAYLETFQSTIVRGKKQKR